MIPSSERAIFQFLLLVTLPALLLVARARAQTETHFSPNTKPPYFTSLNTCEEALREATKYLNAPAMPAPFRVLSWNTQKISQPDATELLSHLDARSNVLMLQEAILERHKPETPPLWRSFSPGYQRGDRVSGVELRSRTPFDLHCSLQVQEPWLRTPKAIGVMRLPFASQSILVVNLHAINFTLGDSDYRKQFSQVGRLLEAHSGPAIVGGDLNNWNSARQRVLEEFARKYRLHQVAFTPDWRSRHIGTPVDGLLLRDLNVVDASALPTHLSDHNPVGASLTYNAASRAPRAFSAETSSPDPVKIPVPVKQQERNYDARR